MKRSKMYENIVDIDFQVRNLKGRFFQEYKLVRCLGGGAFGLVLEVKDRYNRVFAVKVIKSEELEEVIPKRKKMKISLQELEMIKRKIEESFMEENSGREGKEGETLNGEYFNNVPERIPRNIEELKIFFERDVTQIRGPKQISTSPKEIEKEIRNIIKLDCSDRAGYVVRLYDFWKEDEFYFLKFEKLDGDFREVVEEFGTSEEPADHRLFSYARDVCRAYDFISMKGVVHCDLKASNIFLATNSRHGGKEIVIGDFGLATSVSGEDRGKDVRPIHFFLENFLYIFHGSKIFERLKKVFLSVLDDMIRKKVEELKSMRDREEVEGDGEDDADERRSGEDENVFRKLAEAIKEECPLCVVPEACVEYVEKLKDRVEDLEGDEDTSSYLPTKG